MPEEEKKHIPSKIEQRSIEQYFDEYNVSDPDKKAKILPEITDIIYDRNMLAVEFNKDELDGDDYRKNQIFTDIEELEEKIKETFEDYA